MDWPLGDRRRPPAVTLLAAMIEYWGVRMTPPSSGEQRHFLGDGRVLTIYSAVVFENAGPDCRIVGRGLAARCMVGKGSVTIVADADLIDDRLRSEERRVGQGWVRQCRSGWSPENSKQKTN